MVQLSKELKDSSSLCILVAVNDLGASHIDAVSICYHDRV